MAKTKLSKHDITRLANLAGLAVSSAEAKDFTPQLEETLSVIEKLNQLDTSNTPVTSQVTGLSNIFREDQINPSRVLSQKQATANASQTHRGYFVVSQLIDHEA